MEKSKLLLIGTIPPPIGGVSIHVFRLIEHLKAANKKYSFFDLKRQNLFQLIGSIKRHEIIHLHSSNPFFRLGISIICFCFRKRLFSTIHGDLGRFSKLGNFFDMLSIRIVSYPILINNRSFQKSVKINSNSILISSFIPPLKIKELPDSVKHQLLDFSSKYVHVFSTNASHLSYDVNKMEVYGISFLVDFFKTYSENGLIISDPSSEYVTYFESNRIKLPDNVLFITGEHDFYEILKMSDVFIRATTTDGDALSIREALYLGKDVICTDVVDRPQKTFLFKLNDNYSFQKAIEHVFNERDFSKSSYSEEDSFSKLLKLYNL